jgi:hypothetical protein
MRAVSGFALPQMPSFPAKFLIADHTEVTVFQGRWFLVCRRKAALIFGQGLQLSPDDPMSSGSVRKPVRR